MPGYYKLPFFFFKLLDFLNQSKSFSRPMHTTTLNRIQDNDRESNSERAKLGYFSPVKWNLRGRQYTRILPLTESRKGYPQTATYYQQIFHSYTTIKGEKKECVPLEEFYFMF